MLISKSALNEFLDRRLDSYLWTKKLTARDINRELRQFDVVPEFKTKPWLHQLACFYIGACEPRFLFLLDMGLGKSKILADIITQIKREGRLQHALVTVPRVINMDSWRGDLHKHSDLVPWTCDIPNIEEKWQRLSNPQGDVTVIDYQGLIQAVCVKKKAKKGNKLEPCPKRIRILQDLYNVVGIDESHYLKNHQGLWFRVMSQLTKYADNVYATTGTVFDKNPEDLWAQFYLVDRGETFGENLGMFRYAFFSQVNDNFATHWEYNRRSSEDLNRMLQHKSIRYDEAEISEIDLPDRAPNITLEMDFGEEQREHYRWALQGLINMQNGHQVDLTAPWTRMRQILSGYMEWRDADGLHHVRFKDNPKLTALEGLIADMGDSKMVICHHYTETGKIITEHLTKLKIKHEWLHGGSKDKNACRTNFMKDDACRVLVMNSIAGGTGNDGLQEVAKYMIFFETPTSPTVRKQTEKRIHRPGQKHRTFFYDLVIRKSLDKGILDDIAQGKDLYESVVNGTRVRRMIFR